MTDTYKLSFQTVKQGELYKYCNANPYFYKNVTQTVPNSQIPDEDWHTVTKETDNPWDQARRLKIWADSDKEFVRNIKLEKMISEPQWEEVQIV